MFSTALVNALTISYVIAMLGAITSSGNQASIDEKICDRQRRSNVGKGMAQEVRTKKRVMKVKLALS